MRALRPAEIGFFRYCSERKQWEVVLNDQLPLALRRGMTAEQITSFSPCKGGKTKRVNMWSV